VATNGTARKRAATVAAKGSEDNFMAQK